MFFIPNRLSVFGNELYVSFNIAVIPTDMLTNSLHLHIPLPPGSIDPVLTIYEIQNPWDEQSIHKVRPASAHILHIGVLSPDVSVATFDLLHYAHAWRFDSLENHGVHVQLHALNHVLLSEENPPYLLLNTI